MLYDFFLGAGGDEGDGQGEGDLLAGLSSGSGLQKWETKREQSSTDMLFSIRAWKRRPTEASSPSSESNPESLSASSSSSPSSPSCSPGVGGGVLIFHQSLFG